MEEIYFDHNNERAFERITLTKDEKKVACCFGLFVFVFTAIDIPNTTWFIFDNWNKTPFGIMCGLYIIELITMISIFGRLLYNLRYVSYNNYLLHRKQMCIYFFWYFANTVMRFTYEVLHFVTGQDGKENDDVANHPEEYY